MKNTFRLDFFRAKKKGKKRDDKKAKGSTLLSTLCTY
jgi:hypothetical protein